jgi:hypothetical protein
MIPKFPYRICDMCHRITCPTKRVQGISFGIGGPYNDRVKSWCMMGEFLFIVFKSAPIVVMQTCFCCIMLDVISLSPYS